MYCAWNFYTCHHTHDHTLKRDNEKEEAEKIQKYKNLDENIVARVFSEQTCEHKIKKFQNKSKKYQKFS